LRQGEELLGIYRRKNDKNLYREKKAIASDIGI
jgi:hypothetical protein